MTESTYFLSSDFPTCSFPDCMRQAQKRSGLCISHREQQKKGRELTVLPLSAAEIQERFGGICRLDICDAEVWVKGYCKYHYQQYQRGRPFKERPSSAARSKPCTFPGCDRLQHSKGHCSTHAKQRRDGRELTPLPIRSTTTKCLFETCELVARSKGLCSAHYSQSRRGDGTLTELQDYFTPDIECEIPWCERAADRRGMCKGHRNQMKKYGLSVDQMMKLFKKNRCDICDSPPDLRSLHVDHDHKCCPGSGSCGDCVRGLLCGDCNLSIGKLGDNPDTLERAAAYLREGKYEFN